MSASRPAAAAPHRVPVAVTCRVLKLSRRRYERKAGHFLAFTSIACTLIGYPGLTK
ncbi:hypothetical protein ACWF76_29090 [Streptomyces globisporus]